MCIKLVEKELKNIVLMGLNDKGYISVKNIIWALKHLKKKKLSLVIIYSLFVINVLLELGQVYLQKTILDELAYMHRIPQALFKVLGLALVYVGAALSFYLIGIMTHRLFYFWRESVVDALYSKIQKMSIIQYEGERIAKITVLFTDIEQQGQELFRLQYKVNDIIKLIIVALILTRERLSIFFVLLVLNIAAVLCTTVFSKIIRNNEIEMENLRFSSQIKFEEGISGLRELISYQCCENHVMQIKTLFSNYLKRIKKYMELKNSLACFTELIKWIGVFWAVYLAWKSVMIGEMTVGMFYLVYQFASQFNNLFKQINDFRGNIAQADAKPQKLRDAMDSIKELDFAKGMNLNEPITSIAFKNAHYIRESKEIVRDFNAEFLIGKKNALIGVSGSGKTSIANLLVKNYLLSSGKCIINTNYDLNQISIDSWLKKITIVYQDSYFFPDSIRNNLTLGNTEISDEQIYYVCEKMMIKEFIDKQPNKLDEYIGERGVNISGGQKQRLALVKAILRHSEILILDEATSALDEDLERIVQSNLEELMSDRTLIIISHRKIPLENVNNKIIVETPMEV